jgi:hypothetical protein
MLPPIKPLYMSPLILMCSFHLLRTQFMIITHTIS